MKFEDHSGHNHAVVSLRKARLSGFQLLLSITPINHPEISQIHADFRKTGFEMRLARGGGFMNRCTIDLDIEEVPRWTR